MIHSSQRLSLLQGHRKSLGAPASCLLWALSVTGSSFWINDCLISPLPFSARVITRCHTKLKSHTPKNCSGGGGMTGGRENAFWTGSAFCVFIIYLKKETPAHNKITGVRWDFNLQGATQRWMSWRVVSGMYSTCFLVPKVFFWMGKVWYMVKQRERWVIGLVFTLWKYCFGGTGVSWCGGLPGP